MGKRIKINGEIDTSVTFDKITFLNKGSLEEVTLSQIWGHMNQINHFIISLLTFKTNREHIRYSVRGLKNSGKSLISVE